MCYFTMFVLIVENVNEDDNIVPSLVKVQPVGNVETNTGTEDDELFFTPLGKYFTVFLKVLSKKVWCACQIILSKTIQLKLEYPLLRTLCGQCVKLRKFSKFESKKQRGKRIIPAIPIHTFHVEKFSVVPYSQHIKTRKSIISFPSLAC